MRPALTMTIFLAALLAALPADSDAQAPDSDVSSSDTKTVTQPNEQTHRMAPQSEAEKAEAKRLARLEQQKEEERLRQERARQCVIKPVMTDAEIARCKEVWR